MGLRTTLLVAAAALAGWLALLLATDDLGLGRTADGDRAWPYLVEDPYDVSAYQKRGRWLASGGRPYLDEFSEYPQLTTWLYGLPWLAVDHDVERGEPFGSRRAVEDLLRRAGSPPTTTALVLGRIVDARGEPSAAELAALDEAARRVAPRVAEDEAEARTLLVRARAAHAAAHADLEATAPAWRAAFQVLCAALFLAWTLVLALHLRALGASPGWALLALLPGSLYFGFNRFDLPVVVMLGLALLAQARGRDVLAAGTLGLAVFAKWWPLGIVPLLLSHQLARARARRGPLGIGGSLRALAPSLAALAGVALAVLGTTFLHGGGGWAAVWELPRWHLEDRQPNHASLLSLLSSPQAFGVVPLAWRGELEVAFKALQLLPGFALALRPVRTHDALLAGGLVVAACAVLFSEFFSPQWVLWLAALAIPLAPRRPAVLGLLVALDLAMRLTFLFHLHAIETGHELGARVVAVARVLGLVALAALALALCLRAGSPRPRGGPAPAPARP